jgi:HNH endonuclease/C2H2 type zinc finger protein
MTSDMASPMTCRICGQTFPNPSQLRGHKFREHPPDSRVYVCECGRTFTRETGYIRHHRAHHTNEAERRFWAMVDKRGPDECWEWTGSANKYGYGRFSYPGGRYAKPHRFSYELHVGPIPAGLTIDHLCRNRQGSAE